MTSRPPCVQTEVDLTRYASNKAGSIAAYVAQPTSKDEVRDLFRWINEEQLEWFVLGGGANTLLCEERFEGVIIRLAMRTFDITGTTVRADAGANWQVVGLKASQAGLTGLEAATVIPGTVGGAIVGNAGAYDQETKDTLVSVEYYDPAQDQFVIVKTQDLAFGYRHSLFKERSWIIVGAVFALAHGDVDEIMERVAQYRAHRSETQPLHQPSTGCVFKNPPGQHAGKLIDEAGLKGFRIGDAMVSDVHANFIVNLGNARIEDIHAVREHVKKTVKEQKGIDLEEENIVLSPSV